MYCPKCAQEQISDDAKFCTRCGLPLNGLAEWLAARGNVLGEHQHEARTFALSRRRKRIRRGAKLMFLGGVLLPFFFVFSLAVNEPGFLIVPLTVFILGASWALYSRIFTEEISPNQQSMPAALRSAFDRATLPPASHNPLGDFVKPQVETGEMRRPPSVTERTTHLLNKDQN